ncbi:MAG: hypothetical protein AB1490_02030 [Pseudomonadota bacterium]
MTAFRTKEWTVSIRTAALACVLIGVGFSQAQAQFPAPGGASPFPPAPGQAAQPGGDPFPPAPGGPARDGAARGGPSPFPEPGGGGGGGNQAVCAKFPEIRADTEKAAGAIKAASEKKASREEVCPLFQRFAAAEARMLKFLTDNQRNCGVPADAIRTVKGSHARTLQMRTAVCSAAPRPAGPSLSDALSSPILPDAEDKKPGRGTFDTLTGSPLAR